VGHSCHSECENTTKLAAALPEEGIQVRSDLQLSFISHLNPAKLEIVLFSQPSATATYTTPRTRGTTHAQVGV